MLKITMRAIHPFFLLSDVWNFLRISDFGFRIFLP